MPVEAIAAPGQGEISMFTTNVKFRQLALGSALFCVCSALGFWPRPSARVGAEQPGATGAQPEAKDCKLKELLKERLAVLREVSSEVTANYRQGKESFDRVQQATRALLDAELDVCETDKDRITVLEKIVILAKQNETHAEQRFRLGGVPRTHVLMATAGRLETEIALERAKSKAPARPK
jgi:hypothetical protein